MRRTLPTALAAMFILAASPAQASTRSAEASTITADAEAPPVHDDEAGGYADADDPAIWVHPDDRSRTRIVGTVKNGGLRVYDLAGHEVQSIPAPLGGRFNNVDITNGNLAVVTDRGRDQLRFYRFDRRTARLTDVTAGNPPLLFAKDQEEVAEQTTGYGLATYGNLAVVSRRHTARLGFFRIKQTGTKVTYVREDEEDLPTTFTLRNGAQWSPCEEPQVEGMVIDPRTNTLYAGQEDVALWRIDLRTKRRTAVEYVAEFGAPYDKDNDCAITGPGEGGRIHADVEGATIYGDYLLISSQGDSRFLVYDRRTNRPLTSLAVTDGPRTDGVQHSDGAAATTARLPGYPRGLLVVHDGEDDSGGTNFKIVDWRRLARLL
ncbi:phytase [Actinoplanes sp. RD1]|uniref:phytase n=1 Tax=Actinoplanes sp. RD1 TaxID=3064538 RepID=UPI00274167C1|nr:phytase [Actinoplanes sp. RD1]